MRIGRSIFGICIVPVLWGVFSVATAQFSSPGPQPSPPSVPTAPSFAPVVRAAAPEIVGVGGKMRLQGQNLGNENTTAVVFHPGVVAEVVERHTPNEIVVRVPIGAQSGPVKVVNRVNAPALRTLQTQIGVMEGSLSPAVQTEIVQMKQQQNMLLAFGRASNPVQRTVIVAYMEPKPIISPEFEEADGLKIIRNRLIVDLKDFLSFDVALQIANQIGAELVGHFPITNSYVLDLRRAPRDLQALEAIIAQVERDPRVAEVWKDFVLELKQVRFADVDVVDRYQHNYNPNLNGREDVWATDRIQAPGAWNLIERFIGRDRLNHVKVAVMDTGCDHTHPEFNGVALRKVVGRKISVRIAGRGEVLPLAAAYDDSQAYDLGDSVAPYQHGTRVTSLIGARNGNVLDAAHGDRGMNGLLHNPMRYTIQVYRGGDWHEANDWSSLTEFLSVINVAALTRASVMNASWGQPHPINPATSARRTEIRVALRKLAHQLNQFRDNLLLVVAAGNEAQRPDPEGMRGQITPFEDLNLNGRLDAGEDFNSNGNLDHGNYVAASLGTLPNVITVGAIGGPDHDQAPERNNWAHDDQRAEFSNWGVPVTIAAPGTDVFAAGGNRFQIGGAGFSWDDPTNSGRSTTGTSFAAPLVAGSATLLKAIAPALTPSQLKNYLHNTAYEVNTTDGAGNQMVWKTLKTGYAVRQLMVERGIIGNDQQWTGVSKVVYDGLRMFEVRRGAGGRAQAFADRALPNLTGQTPSLAHPGGAVIWIADPRTVLQHSFITGTTSPLVVLNPPSHLEPAILEASPNLGFLFGVRSGRADDCEQRIKINVGGSTVADTGDFNTCRYRLGIVPRDWQSYSLYKAAWRPDSRAWALDYFYSDGTGNTIHQTCRAWWGDNPFPAASINFPICTGTEFRYPAWAPDGRAYAGAVGDTRLRIAYYGNAHSFQFHWGNDVGDAPILWINWSPDGSELGYIGANGLSTIRRDIRTRADRNPLLLQGGINGAFTWQW